MVAGHGVIGGHAGRRGGERVRRALVAALAATGAGLAPIVVAAPASADGATTVPDVVITKIFDGLVPFDAATGRGNDVARDNGLVRAGDLAGYRFDYSLNDPRATEPTPYDGVTMASEPLPLGFVFDALPATCTGRGSGVAGDGVKAPSVLTCNMETRITGQAWSMTAAVRALPTVVDGTNATVAGTISAADVAARRSDAAATITATSLPKLDIQKGHPRFAGTATVDGVLGYRYVYPVGIKMKLGSEVPALPITFTEDFTDLPRGTKFIGCGVSGEAINSGVDWAYGFGMPSGRLGSLYPPYDVPERQVEDSGRVRCESSGRTTVAFTIDDAHVNPEHYPTLTSDGSPINPMDRWIVADYAQFLVPADTMSAANSFSVSALNKITGFAPKGRDSGTENYGDPTLEPGRGLDNVETAGQTALTGTEDNYRSVLRRPSPGAWDKYDFKFADQLGGASFDGPMTSGKTWGASVGSSDHSGDGTIGAGARYTAMNRLNFTGLIDVPAGFINCMTIDQQHVSVTPVPGRPTRGGYIWDVAAAVPIAQAGAAWVVEYGIGGAGGAGSTWAAAADQQAGTCANGDSTAGTWYSDLTQVPGGAAAVTKVRARTTRTYSVREQQAAMTAGGAGVDYARLLVGLTPKPGTPPGTLIPNYQSVYSPDKAWVTSPDGWDRSDYDYRTALGERGDRVIMTGTSVRVNKTVDSSSRLVGKPSTWTLTPTSDALGASPPGQSVRTTMVDTVPDGLTYVAGSAQCSAASAAPSACEPVVSKGAGGGTTLRWDFGTFTSGSDMSVIKIITVSDPTIGDGEELVNTVVVAAENDNSPENYRTADAEVVLVNPAVFAVRKKALDPLVEPGDPFRFDLFYRNTSKEVVASTDFIDWLPFNGDDRVPPTARHGSIALESVTRTSGRPVQLRYSKYPVTRLALPTSAGSGDFDPKTIDPAIAWCTRAEFGTSGCPGSLGEVTGLRWKTGAMAPGESGELRMTVSSTGDAEGDVFTNRFRGRLAGSPLPVESNNVHTTVVLCSIGNQVWEDADRNGRLDEGEPGIGAATVELLDGAGAVLATTTTDSAGRYRFDRLRHGTYRVRVVPPSGGDYAFTGRDQGADTVDSDLDPQTGTSGPITVALHENDITVDAGLVRQDTGPPAPVPGTVPDRVTALPGRPITFDPLLNDVPPLGASFIRSTLRLISLRTDKPVTEVRVPGEAAWSLSADGMVTVTPVEGFVGRTTPVSYLVRDTKGGTTRASMTVDVRGATPTAGSVGSGVPTILARTGAEPGPWVLLGLVFLLAGTGTLLTNARLARRRPGGSS
jgi:hypothetical protein